MELSPLSVAPEQTPDPLGASRPRLHVRPPQSTPAHRKTLRELVRESCANKPGTYRMLGANGAVIYVGKSRVLRTRLLSYFRARGARNKAARILRHAFHIEWEYAPTEFGALLRELRLIKQYRPHFNRQMVSDDWPRGYIALIGGDVPGLRVVPRSDYPQAVVMYGPFRKVRELKDAVRVLADFAGVRDCAIDDAERGVAPRPLWFADSPRKRKPGQITGAALRVPGCLRRDLGSCVGPCVGEGRAAPYRAAIQVARAFLDGSSDALLRDAIERMHRAADNLEFERAGALRDRISHLQWLHERLQRFHADVDRLTFRYHALRDDGTTHVYLVRRGTVRADGPLPEIPDDVKTWEARVAEVYSGSDPRGADVPRHDVDEFHLIASWFRKRPAEKTRTFKP